MKQKSIKKKIKVISISILIIILVSILVFYTQNSFLMSSCTILSGQVEDGGLNHVGEDFKIGPRITCPEPDIEYVEPPSGSGSNNPPSSSGSSSGSGSKIMNSPEVNSSENKSKINLSPIINESEKNTYINSSLSDQIIKEYIIKNKIEVDCIIYNESIENNIYMVTIEGHRTIRVLGIKIIFPIEAKMLISKDKIVLECIRFPWWAYFFR